MTDLNFPEISKEIQQSVYGACGGSNSNDPNAGWYDNGDGITIIGNGGSGGGGGSDDGWGFEWFSQNGNPDNNLRQFMVDFLTSVNNGQIQTAPRP
ncbi:hypothetical protein [Flavobacterium sp. CSZ]|uniref:hypothetical protein n=1 Tax=Flavobacterium sp. CSZ TaxID=2783791 RepID=UPI00188C3A92|nr:hypothetical protein [Flavobacterium sp. CSZ]MBF4485720.1 hypothetical protein [Flavobacterium sp. CSZ]